MSTVILRKCNRTDRRYRPCCPLGGTDPTVDIDRVCCFVLLLYRYLGIVTVPGSIPYGSRLGVAGSSPCTLIMSLAIPVPSSSSSNGPTPVPLITMGLCHGSSRVGRSKVRSASLVRVFSDENGPSGTGSQSLSNHILFFLRVST